ncbi:MAG: cytochrome C [Trichlorobacter sp.]|jgi:cytochrome c5
MRHLTIALAVVASCGLTACSMFSAWKSIPPPGGCNECHSGEISANWKVMYQPVILSNEQGRLPFQQPGYDMPGRPSQPRSELDVKKVEDSRCFECHSTPNQAHTQFKGRYHHGF